MLNRLAPRRGFTVVELLIVIVIVAILAAISIVAYNGIQDRARDTQRKAAISTIAKALDMYFIKNGSFPSSACGLGTGCKINSGWLTTADPSWVNIESALVPDYISAVPKDPKASQTTSSAISGGQNFDYYMMVNGWCGTSASKPGYMLTYRLEGSAQKDEIIGDCPSSATQPYNYSSSQYIVVK